MVKNIERKKTFTYLLGMKLPFLILYVTWTKETFQLEKNLTQS